MILADESSLDLKLVYFKLDDGGLNNASETAEGIKSD